VGIAAGVGEEQAVRRMKKKRKLVLTTEKRVEGMRVTACLCIGGF
jgi:hypothetical protein